MLDLKNELKNKWKHKSLANLDRSYANIPINYTTTLTEKCTKLLLVPLSDYTVEDLRMMIGQGFGLSYLIPLATEKLKEDVFAEGDFYPGDLLSNVININAIFWSENKNYWIQINELIAANEQAIKDNGISTDKFKTAIIRNK